MDIDTQTHIPNWYFAIVVGPVGCVLQKPFSLVWLSLAIYKGNDAVTGENHTKLTSSGETKKSTNVYTKDATVVPMP